MIIDMIIGVAVGPWSDFMDLVLGVGPTQVQDLLLVAIFINFGLIDHALEAKNLNLDLLRLSMDLKSV